jgi:hypothetical protein
MIASVVVGRLPRVACAMTHEVGREVGMVRTAAVLSVLALLVLGAGVLGDDPVVWVALVGTALCALGCAASARAVGAATPAVVVPGRSVPRATATTARQHHPDTAGRPRPRAPGAPLAAT